MNKERIRRGFELEIEECKKKIANNEPSYIQYIDKHNNRAADNNLQNGNNLQANSVNSDSH